MRQEFDVHTYLRELDMLVTNHGTRVGVPTLAGFLDDKPFGYGVSNLVANDIRSHGSRLQSGSIAFGVKGIVGRDSISLDEAFVGARVAYHEIRHIHQNFNKGLPDGNLGMALRFNTASAFISPTYYGVDDLYGDKPIVYPHYWHNVCELDAEVYSWEMMPEWLRMQDMPDSEIGPYCCAKMNAAYFVDGSHPQYFSPDEPFESYESALDYLKLKRNESVHRSHPYDYAIDSSPFGRILMNTSKLAVYPYAAFGDEISSELDGLVAVAKLVNIGCKAYSRFSERCHLTEDDVRFMSDSVQYQFPVGFFTKRVLRPLHDNLKARLPYVSAGVGFDDGDAVLKSVRKLPDVDVQSTVDDEFQYG